MKLKDIEGVVIHFLQLFLSLRWKIEHPSEHDFSHLRSKFGKHGLRVLGLVYEEQAVVLEATLSALFSKLSVPGLHQFRFHLGMWTDSLSPLGMILMRRNPATAFLAHGGDAVLLWRALFVTATFKILLVQLIARDHLDAVFKGNFGPRVMIDPLLNVPQLWNYLLLDRQYANVTLFTLALRPNLASDVISLTKMSHEHSFLQSL